MSDLFKFHTTIPVRISDLNYAGHVGNDSYLTIFHDARIRYLNNLDCSEVDIGDSISLIMTCAHVEYKSQAVLNDELRVEVRVASMTSVRFRMEYEITNNVNRKLVSVGYTELAGYDYNRGKIHKLPELFINKVKAFEGI